MIFNVRPNLQDFGRISNFEANKCVPILGAHAASLVVTEDSIDFQSRTDAINQSADYPDSVNNALKRGKKVVCENAKKVYCSYDAENRSLLILFEEMIRAISNDNTRHDAEKFLSAFRLFEKGKEILVDAVTPVLINDFRTFLASRGHTASYITKRLQNFRSLYRKLVKEGRAPSSSSDCFEAIDSSHPKGNSAARRINKKGSTLKSLKKLVRMPINNPELAASRDRLVEYILSAGNVPQQFDEHFVEDATILLRSLSLGISDFSPSVPSELWIWVARECGISAAEIASACHEIPAGFAESLISADCRNIDPDSVLQKVADAVFQESKDWYALKLYTGYDSKTVANLIATNDKLSGVKTYAPVERLMIRKGKHLKSKVVDRIRGVMFIEAESTTVAEIARTLQSVASFYRQSRTANSPVARIPQREMDNFRILIDGATFAELELAESAQFNQLHAGAEVEITDGPFAGYRGTIISNGTSRTLIVALSSDFGIKVTANIPDIWLSDWMT